MRAIASGLLIMVMAGFVSISGAIADNRDPPPPPTDWKSTEFRDHPLVGKIWSAHEKSFVSLRDFGRSMALARFVLLGEIHDNADHHLWQAWVIRTVSKLRGSRIVEGAPQLDIIAMEMVRTDQYDALDKFYGRNVAVPRPRKARDFGRILQWSKSGWPDFEIYAPIIDQAIYEQLVIVPASVSRDFTRKLSKEGVSALSSGEPERLALAEPLEKERGDALSNEISESHCGMIPSSAIPSMSFVQRFRDATMADSLLSVAEGKGGILIAGNGHIRRDRGVPWYLEKRGVPANSIATLKMAEVSPDSTDPEDYIDRSRDGAPSVDFVAFTPKTGRADPCEKMREHMQKKTGTDRS